MGKPDLVRLKHASELTRTERGRQLTVWIRFDGTDEEPVSLWFPKSVLQYEQGEWYIERWMVERKENEIGEQKRFQHRKTIEILTLEVYD